jgi:tripartite motif-containing protein 71
VRDLRRVSSPAFAAALAAIVAAGCGGASHSAANTHTSSGQASSSTPKSARVPNPFKVVARYSSSSLGLRQPAGLAIGPDGNLYITDASQRVTVVSPEGKVLRRWGRPGKGPGEFDFVKHDPGVPGVSAGIAVGADGRVYVDDSGNSRIEVFSSTGAFIRKFGSFGYGRGQIVFSNYIAADKQGNVYVADDQQETLTKYSSNGAVDWTIGGASAVDPDLSGHFHFSTSSIDLHGRLVLANDDQHRIVYIDASGHKVDAFGSRGDFRDVPGAGGACDVTVDANGDTFVGSCAEPLSSPHYTEVFDRTHHLIGAWWPSPFGFSPRFGPQGEVFTLGEDGSILKLKVALGDA